MSRRGFADLSRLRLVLGLLLAIAASMLHAAEFPQTVTDLADRRVTLDRAPQRIVLQDSNDVLSFALLEPEQPLTRIVAWDNNLASSDPALWRLVSERWPAAARVQTLDFPQTGTPDIERLLRTHPDLIIARLAARPAIDNSVLPQVLQRLGIALIYVDNENDPLNHVPRSLTLLGQVLGQEARATAYLSVYEAQLAQLRARTAGLPAPKVFVEARAGQAGAGACCHTQSHTGWGLLIETLGGINLGSRYLRSQSADVAMETLILSKPDLYLMTGTQRVRKGVAAIPFGYDPDRQAIASSMAALLARPGFTAIAQSPQSCFEGLNHQFYNSVFNIIGAQWLAKLMWPEALRDLDPDTQYRQLIATFTTLPDRPFVFQASACLDDPAAPL